MNKVKKAMSLIMVMGILLNYILPITTVFAAAPTNMDNYAALQINGATSIENLDNTNIVVATFEHGTANITGSGLYSDGSSMIYVPEGNNVTVDVNGAQNYSGTIICDGNQTNGSTLNLNSIAKKSGGAPYIIDINFSDNQQPQPGNNENGAINYSYSGGVAEFFINDSHFDSTIATPGANNNENTGTYTGSLGYNYDNTGIVTLNVEPLFINRITSLVVNGTEYATTANFPTTPDEILHAIDGQIIHYSVEVPYAATYNISTTMVPNEGEYMTVGNFLWSYQEQDKGTDDYVGNGLFELVKVKYQGNEYNEEELANLNLGYMQWSQSPDEGGALLPAGAELTVKLLPNPGYQLTSFTINGGEFQAGTEVGTYTFEVPRGNFHLGAHFTKVKNEVDSSDSEAISSGSISLGGNESNIEHGTAKLEVKDVDLNQDDIDGFENAAGGYNVRNYLDISLYNTVYKGSSVDTWDSQITELDYKAKITLKLADDVDGNEVVIVHQKHD